MPSRPRQDIGRDVKSGCCMVNPGVRSEAIGGKSVIKGCCAWGFFACFFVVRSYANVEGRWVTEYPRVVATEVLLGKGAGCGVRGDHLIDECCVRCVWRVE